MHCPMLLGILPLTKCFQLLLTNVDLRYAQTGGMMAAGFLFEGA